MRKMKYLFKKLLEPNIEIKTNLPALIGITVASLYGLYYMVINLVNDIKDLM